MSSNDKPMQDDEWRASWSAFAALMVKQMEHNAHRGYRDRWFYESLDLELNTLMMNIQEVRNAMVYGIDVEEKLADVANWACIMYDNWTNNPGSHIGGVPIADPNSLTSGVTGGTGVTGRQYTGE